MRKEILDFITQPESTRVFFIECRAISHFSHYHDNTQLNVRVRITIIHVDDEASLKEEEVKLDVAARTAFFAHRRNEYLWMKKSG